MPAIVLSGANRRSERVRHEQHQRQQLGDTDDNVRAEPPRKSATPYSALDASANSALATTWRGSSAANRGARTVAPPFRLTCASRCLGWKLRAPASDGRRRDGASGPGLGRGPVPRRAMTIGVIRSSSRAMASPSYPRAAWLSAPAVVGKSGQAAEGGGQLVEDPRRSEGHQAVRRPGHRSESSDTPPSASRTRRSWKMSSPH